MISRIEYLLHQQLFYINIYASPGEFLVLSVLQTTQTDSKSAARSVLAAYLLEIDARARLKCQFALLLRRHVAACRLAFAVCVFEVNVVLFAPAACTGRFASKQQHTRLLRVDVGVCIWALHMCTCVLACMYIQRRPLPYWSAYCELWMDGRMDGRLMLWLPTQPATHIRQRTHQQRRKRPGPTIYSCVPPRERKIWVENCHDKDMGQKIRSNKTIACQKFKALFILGF